MAWNQFEQCVCRMAALLYRCDDDELARAEHELRRLLRLAGHYLIVARGAPTAGEAGSASHLCRSPAAPGTSPSKAPSPPPRRHRKPSR